MIGIIPEKQQTSFGDKSSQEKKDLEEEKKRLENLSQHLTYREDYLNKKSLEYSERFNKLSQRESELNNILSSNIPDVFFLMDRDLDNLPFELPMDWVHRENMWVSYLIGNERKTSLHSFLKCALPESDNNEYDSIIKEEYMQKIYKLFRYLISSSFKARYSPTCKLPSVSSPTLIRFNELTLYPNVSSIFLICLFLPSKIAILSSFLSIFLTFAGAVLFPSITTPCCSASISLSSISRLTFAI